MEQREPHLQPLGICYRLYHFIMKTLASQALKTVTLGRPVPKSNAVLLEILSENDDNKLPPTQGFGVDSISCPTEQAKENNNPCTNMAETGGENMASPTSLADAKAPKKMVSINDNVEEIYSTKKKKNKSSKSFQKSNSLEQKEEEDEEPKPLRSILKVGSKLNETIQTETTVIQ